MSNFASGGREAITTVSELRISDAQREVLSSVALGDDASCAFNMCVRIDFDGVLDKDALAEAVRQLGQRHQMLRARFPEHGETMLVDADCMVRLQHQDLRGASDEDVLFALEQQSQREVTEPFDLQREHAWRVRLIDSGKKTSQVLLTVHHVVADGWSMVVMRNDLEAFYSAKVQGRVAELEEAVDYAEYLEFLRQQQDSGLHEQSCDYWVQQFADGEPVVDFPIDLTRPPQRSYGADRVDLKVPRDVSDALRKMAREQGTSLFNVLFSAFYSYLYRASGAADLVVGVPAAGHSVAGLYEMVGHCVNILPVRQQLRGEGAFEELLKSTRSCMLNAQDHQSFTFSELLGRLNLSRDPSRIPVVSMLFNIDQDPGLHQFADHQGVVNLVPHRYENFELFCNVLDRQGELTIEWAYNTQLFSAEATEHRLHSFVSVLSQIARAPRLSVDDISLYSAADEAVYKRVNSTDFELSAPRTVLSQLHAALERHGDAEAVVAGDVRLSYAQLHAQSNRLANYLAAQGVVKGDWVALCLERDQHMLIAIIALMKLGATYVPLDPAYPADRIAYIIENAKASVVISHSKLVQGLAEHAGVNICLDQVDLSQHSDAAPATPAPSADDLIYVIYTSGSTGNPKGVKLLHRNVANFLATMAQRPGLQADDRLVAVTTLSFDIAVLELMLPLTVGACVVVASREQATDAEALQSLMARESATTLQATPATWRMLFQGGWQGQSDLKALVGGEALPRDLALQLAGCTGQLWNMYGPTETAIWSTCERIKAQSGAISIGRPIGNTQVYVLDELGHPAAVGMPGELLIGGTGVCGGYHQRDDLNAQVFIPDIFSSDPAARLYRTRDRVKLHPDGRLEYLERMDNQVKVRGYRIELGEIETVLGQQPGVRDCAVLAREDQPGDVRLVAYIDTADEAVDERALAQGLRQRLPEFMQPQHYVTMVEMPRTPNGKLDRKALPAPTLGTADSLHELIGARTETERWVAQRWAELVGVAQVGVDQNFFALGGHSLLAMRFIAESRTCYAGSINLRMLLSDTLAQIAASLDPNDKPDAAADIPKLKKRSSTEVFFLDVDSQNVFCAYHAPVTQAPKRAFLIAQPLGHEYQRAHRALQELGLALSDSGCAVLRFDYRNTGDSSGEPEQLGFLQLQQDLRAATDELCQRSGLAGVDVLSMRAASLLVGSLRESRWRHHYAWDPVTNGTQYHALLQRLHAASLADWDRYIKRRPTADSCAQEYLGYDYPAALMSELATVDAQWQPRAQFILSKGVEPETEDAPVLARLQVEPQWDERDDTETHLQVPADLALLIDTLTGTQP